MLAIINATSGRVLIQRADLGMLQTIGFTPGQVMTMLIAEHAALGFGGLVAGLRAARLLASPLLPALLTIGGLAVPMIMITIGLGFWSTLDEVQHDPADIGLAAGLTLTLAVVIAALTAAVPARRYTRVPTTACSPLGCSAEPRHRACCRGSAVLSRSADGYEPEGRHRGGQEAGVGCCAAGLAGLDAPPGGGERSEVVLVAATSGDDGLHYVELGQGVAVHGGVHRGVHHCLPGPGRHLAP
jgi:FtsX-like permease family